MSAAEQYVMSERSTKAMNHMDPDTKFVHARLEEWARWAKESEIRAWPSITLLGRVIEQGPTGSGQSGRPPTDMPEQVASIDRAVCKLGDIDRGVVRTYYLKWEPINVMARRNSMRVLQFQRVLRRARWRIMGYLDAVEVKL
jgi:hypothetical protein